MKTILLENEDRPRVLDLKSYLAGAIDRHLDFSESGLHRPANHPRTSR